MTDLTTALTAARAILLATRTGQWPDRTVRDQPLPVDAQTLTALEAAADALCNADMATDPGWGDRTAADRWEFRDNYRAARADDPAQIAQYTARRDTGCCGSIDLLIDGHLFGFNYGH